MTRSTQDELKARWLDSRTFCNAASRSLFTVSLNWPGRIAAGVPGRAVSLVTAEDRVLLRDIQKLLDTNTPGIIGAITGRAIYEGTLDVAEAQALCMATGDFKRAYDALKTFRNEEYLWFQVAEYTYDNFMIRARARG